MLNLNNKSLKPFTPLDQLIKQLQDKMSKIKYKIVVLSGKGGVGKSFVSSMLALALAERGYKVALLDADLHGSSIPLFLGLRNANMYMSSEGIEPVTGPLNIKIVSINLILPSPDTPVVWRGPLKSKAIIELLAKVNWSDNDFLIIDLPPGTGDEVITIVQVIRDIDGALIVTAPNILSEIVVSKAINFLIDYNIKLLGIVENMSYFKCPDTGKTYYLLGKSTGEELARKYNTELLVKIPFDPYIGEAIGRNIPYYTSFRNGEAAEAIRQLASIVISKLIK